MTPELSPDTRDWLQADVDDTYQRFLARVAEGRDRERRRDRRDRRGPGLDRRAGGDAWPRRRARRSARRGGEGEGEGRHRCRSRRRAHGLPAAEAARRAASRGAARRASRRASPPHYPGARALANVATRGSTRSRARARCSHRRSGSRFTEGARSRRSREGERLLRMEKEFDVDRPACRGGAAARRRRRPLRPLPGHARRRSSRARAQRKTIASHYTALGREGVATFHFDYEPGGDISFEKVCDGRIWRELRGVVTLTERKQKTRVRIELEGRTKALVPEFTIRGPMQDQLEQMAKALRKRARRRRASVARIRRATASSSTSSRTATVRRSCSRAATRPRARTSARRSSRWSPPATASCSGTTAGTATRMRPTIPTPTRSTSCSTTSAACSIGARRATPAVLAGFSFGGARVAALRAASSRARARAGADRHGPGLQEPRGAGGLARAGRAHRDQPRDARHRSRSWTSRAAATAIGRRPELPAAQHAARAIAKMSPRGVANFGRRVSGPIPGCIDELAQIAVPALVVVGAEDEAYLRAADVMAARLPNAKKVVIPRRRPRRQHRRTRSPQRRHPRVPARAFEATEATVPGVRLLPCQVIGPSAQPGGAGRVRSGERRRACTTATTTSG